MSAAARFDQVPALAGELWNCTEATPDPASAELDVSETDPRTLAAAAGAVTAPVGSVLSTRTPVINGDVNVLPALSVVTTWRS